MAKKFLGFTPDQQFTLLSKMGYSGPKDPKSMEQFLAASPSAASKMGAYTNKAQELLQKPLQMADGGVVANARWRQNSAQRGLGTGQTNAIGQFNPLMSAQINQSNEANARLRQNSAQRGLGTGQTNALGQLNPQMAAQRALDTGQTNALGQFNSQMFAQKNQFNVANSPVISQANAQELQQKSLQMADGGVVTGVQTDLDAAQQAYADAQKALATNPEDSSKISDLSTATQNLGTQTEAFKATAIPTGAEAVSAAIQTPESLIKPIEVAKVEEKPDQLIAEGTGQVQAPSLVTPTTVVETAQATAPEKTEAATVDTTKVAPAVEQTLADVTAATGEPTKAATVQGQLEGLMAQFEGGATPPWASGAMRQAMGIMQQRGLGASSIAGQAVVQAAMESAISIASQDAATTAQFEMQNLNNEQQTLIFKTQQRIAGLFTDQAAENASKQFNAASQNQVDQFFAGLQESVSRFNADQVNATMQFNAGQTNAIEQFNSQMSAQRDQFNAANSLVISQANAQWRQNIATLDTTTQNEALMESAKAMNSLTEAGLDEIWQKERDLMAFAWQSAESAAGRANAIILQQMTADSTKEAAKLQADLEGDMSAGAALWGVAENVLTSWLK